MANEVQNRHKQVTLIKETKSKKKEKHLYFSLSQNARMNGAAEPHSYEPKRTCGHSLESQITKPLKDVPGIGINVEWISSWFSFPLATKTMSQ